MKDYTVTITMSIYIRARNQEQADERAEALESAVKIDLPESARWYNHDESTIAIKEDYMKDYRLVTQVAYHAVDGYQGTKFYKTLKGAQRYAQRMVGAHPEMGGNYAISGDGIGKVASNIPLKELFPDID
jgi:hypothetical protein